MHAAMVRLRLTPTNGTGCRSEADTDAIEHTLGVLGALLSRQPGHREGYAIRTDRDAAVLLNLFDCPETAGAALDLVAPMLDAQLGPGRYTVEDAAGPAFDLRWSNT